MHLCEDVEKGMEKLEAWLGTWFQVMLGGFETGALRGEAGGGAEPLLLPQVTWGK